MQLEQIRLSKQEKYGSARVPEETEAEMPFDDQLQVKIYDKRASAFYNTAVAIT